MSSFKRTLFCAIALCLTSVPGWSQTTTPSSGALTYKSATGLSEIVTLEAGVELYGGTAGEPCSGNGSVTCDSCNAATNPSCTNGSSPLCACNYNRIYNDLILDIEFNNPDGVDGKGAVAATIDGTATRLTTESGSSSTRVQVKWRQVCIAMGLSDCEASEATAQVALKIWVDKDGDTDAAPDSGEPEMSINVHFLSAGKTNYNVLGQATATNNGINNFFPYPGDGKIGMEQLKPVGSFDTIGAGGNPGYAGTAKKLMVFFSDVSLKDAVPGGENSFDPVRLTISGEGDEVGLDSRYVNNLENGTTYFFRIALMDEANNVVQFFPDLDLSTSDPTSEAACNTSPSAACKYSGTPDEVVGLLSKDFNCFIATAAFGTGFNSQLKAFRDFRHTILLTRPWGVWFVKKYYDYGPYAARFIADKPVLRSATRAALWPAYGFSLLSLRYGLGTALATSTLALLLLIFIATWTFQKISRRADSRV